ncbi:MAG: type II toxin-antitoxin system VapC family toxin [Chloroflexi bacterium]|nr:type II toxin-antitoxin system VapC family toxin [Chloroflexota bacterium]
MSSPVSYVLDASVLVARVRCSELAYEDVRVLMAALAATAAELSIPTIALAEVAAAISRGGAGPAQALTAVNELQKLPGLRVVAVDFALGVHSSEIAARQRIRGCDAVYVALAHSIGAILITLDQQQWQRSPASVTVLTPAHVLTGLS